MAAPAGEEPEYESDPEDALLPSAMRRREASDDEEGSDSEGRPAREDRRVGSDEESDGQGGAPVYEDDEDFGPEEEEEEEGVEEEDENFVAGEEDGRVSEGGDHDVAVGEAEIPAAESGGDGQRLGGEEADFHGEDQVGEEEKKENEPFAVPTAGAFYMHDDRFRENCGGRHRRTPGGRRLWESKDDRAWVHDRFEEMNLQDAQDEERRTFKGRFRGRGRNHGTDRGYGRGNRAQTYDNRSRAYDDRSQAYNDRPRFYDDNNNQDRAPKSVRGRGPRRYERTLRNNSEMPATQNRQSGKSHDATSNNTTTSRQSSQTSSVQPVPVLSQKHIFASSLNSASPPFYPSGSSNQDISASSKRDAHHGSNNRNLSSPVVEGNLSSFHSAAMLRGKAIVDSVSQDIRSVSGKTLQNMHLPSSGSSLSSTNTTQTPRPRAQGRALTMTGQLNYQPTLSVNQVGRGSAQTQLPAVQQRPIQTPVQPVSASRPSAQQLGQHPSSGPQAASLPQVQSTNASGEMESPPGSSKSKSPVAVKGKAIAQGGGRGSFLYNGAQVIGANGAMTLAHVMQFGGQHPGGLGVPAVGMALPGYVAQPQLGFGNSEMTWVPVLAGASGALGASYGPYLTLDGGYYARPSEQTSSSATSSRETSATKSANIWKSPQRPEIVNDEFGQRQNKPRRYSEMNFGQ